MRERLQFFKKCIPRQINPNIILFVTAFKLAQTLGKDHFMASKTVVVGSAVGLHARPASIIAEAAGEYDEDIFLALEGEEDEETDAASSLMIMALGAEKGDKVVVTSDNAEAVEKIAALIEQG